MNIYGMNLESAVILLQIKIIYIFLFGVMLLRLITINYVKGVYRVGFTIIKENL